MATSEDDDKNRIQEGYSTLGQRIRDVRITKDLTQAQVAEGIITPSMMSQIETGKAVPSFAIIVAIAKKLETSVSQLFRGLSFNKMQMSGYRLAVSHMALGSYSSALPVLQGLYDTDNLDDEISPNELKLNLAICYRETKQYNEAIKLFGALVQEYSRSSSRRDQHKLVHVHLHLSETFERKLMYFEALRSALNARDTYEQQKNDPLLEGKILVHLAELNKRLHRFEDANAFYQLALGVYNQFPEDSEEIGILYQRMAEVHFEQGDAELCIDFANKAIVLLQDARRITNYRETKRLLIMEQVTEENWQDSIDVLLRMASLYTAEDPQREATLYLDVAQIYLMVHDYNGAQVYCLKALGLLADFEGEALVKFDMTNRFERKQKDNQELIGRANLLMAAVYLHNHDHARVVQLLETAIHVFKQHVKLDELYRAASLLTEIVKNGEENEKAWELITGCHDFLFAHLRKRGIM